MNPKKGTEPDTKRLQVRIRRTTYAALDVQARRELLPVAAIVRRVLETHVAALEGEANQDDGGAS